MLRMSHEVGCAVQFYIEGKRYRGNYDGKLETAADLFAMKQLKAMKEAGYDYLTQREKDLG